MAEAVSGVVTLTTFTLTILRETAVFIRDAKEVDVRIQKLLSKLLDLQDWIELVASTCEVAKAHNELVPRCVSDSLVRCEQTLLGVRKILQGLASRKSGTFIQKVKLNIRTESSKREVLEAIDDLQHDKSHIKDCMDLWTHHRTANIERRTSGAMLLSQRAMVGNWGQAYDNEMVSSPHRTLSNASTMHEPFGFGAPTPSPSFTTPCYQLSNDSESSSAPRSLSEQSEQTSPSTAGAFPPESNEDPIDLHRQISKYKDDEMRSQVVRQILERHPRSTVLANTKDEYGRTPLCRAAQIGDLRLAHTLIEFSADINARDSQPCSVLDHALANNRESFVAFLLERGVDDRNVLKRNTSRLEEIKETLALRKTTVAKRKGKGKGKGKGKSRSSFGTITTARVVGG